MVIKGRSVAGADRLATHLSRLDTNERMEMKEVRGVAAEEMREAFREMEAVATGSARCQKPFYHASINTRPDEMLTDEQRMQAIDRLEKEMGLTGQPRVVVVHEKLGREHCHIVWARVNSETLTAIPDNHNYRKHETVAREMEREFGHERVQGAHVEREGQARPERTPSHDEYQQAQRTGIKPKAARQDLTDLWRSTDSGQAFQQALADKGWVLAKGDRRDFVAVDRFGGVHSLSRRIEGAKAADVRARLADIDPKTLASVADARAGQLARLGDRERQTQRRRELAAQGRLRAATTPSPRQRGRQATTGRAEISATRAAGQVATGIGKGVAKLADGLAGTMESLLGGGGARRARDEEFAPTHGAGDDARPLDRGAPLPPNEHEEHLRQAEDAKSATRQRYLRDFDRDVPEEKQREADLTRSHDGGRERKRGE